MNSFICPNCNKENSISGEEFFCQNENCTYKFKVFNKKDDAEKFKTYQPSTKPKQINFYNDKYIVSYCYEPIEPFKVERLSDVIDEDTIKMLLRGFAFRSKLSLVILEKSKELIEGKEFTRIETDVEFSDFCEFIRNTYFKIENREKKGENRCKDSVYRIAKELFDNQEGGIYQKYCWVGLKKNFLPLSINNKNIGMLVCSDIRLDNEEEKDKFRNKINQISENLSEEEKSELKKKAHKLLSDSVAHDEIGKRLDEIRNLKKVFEKIGEDNYIARRQVYERHFLDELDALFSVPAGIDYTRELFEEKLKITIKRINEFSGFEIGIFLTNEINTDKFQTITYHSTGGDKVNISVENDTIVSALFEKMDNIFLSDKHDDLKFKKFKEILKPIEIKFISICPFNLIGDKEGLLLLINRTKKFDHNITYIEEFINGLLRDFVNHLRIFYTSEERKDHLAITFHTMNQSMETLIAKATYLYTNLQNKNEVKEEDIITIKDVSKKIEADVEAMERRVKVFYYFTAIGTDAEEYRFDKPFPLVKLIEDCKDRYIHYAHAREIDIEIKKDDYIPHVFWDKDKIDIAISNVIHNAIKFSDKNKNITIWLSRKGEIIYISINNFGFGIALEDKDRIFNAFKRSKIKDTRRPIPWTGLGLSIAKRFIEKHGGTIRVMSKKDGREHSISDADFPDYWKGFNTDFTISIPINPK